MSRKNVLLIAALAFSMVLFAFAAGCTSNPAGNTGTVEKTTAVVTTQEPVEITVFAAASLKGALTDIIDQFQAENKNIKVVTNFAGSQALKTQIQEGADVDIFISANDKQFDPINEAGMIKEKKVLLTNKLAIAVPAANTAGISNLGDLSKSGTILVIGNKDVPFGSYTRDIIQKYQDDGHAGYVDAFMGNVVSEVDAVDKIKPVLVLGEADGSIVYKSDISKADKKDITLIEIPDKYNVIASYPYGLIKANADKPEVKLFEAYLTGDKGTAVLKEYGFDVGTSSAGTSDAEPAEITIFAAASLKGALTDIVNQFMEENKNVKVKTNFAGSQTLKTQIQEGADVDIYISANDKQFDPINEAGMIEEKKVLLTNKLAIAVPVDNKAGIKDLGDLSKKGVILVIGNKDVPFGQYTRNIIEKYQEDGNDGYVDAFMGNVVSEVDAVDKIKPVLVLGEADGSIVYKSDISKADRKDITLIEIPDKYNVIASYPYGVLKANADKPAVKLFESYLTGEKGTAVLKEYGFDVSN